MEVVNTRFGRWTEAGKRFCERGRGNSEPINYPGQVRLVGKSERKTDAKVLAHVGFWPIAAYCDAARTWSLLEQSGRSHQSHDAAKFIGTRPNIGSLDARDLTLILNSPTRDSKIDLFINDTFIDNIDCAALETARPSRWHSGYGIAFKIDLTINNITLVFRGGGDALFQGCLVSTRVKCPP